MGESKPFLAVLVIQVIYAGYFLLTKLAFDVGMNTFVFVFYRQASATLFLAPIAIFMERKSAPPLSFSIFIKIFMLSLFGITMSLDIVGVGLKYTSASLGAATSNTLPVITFFLAVLLRMERVNISRSPGILKVCGVVLCMGGVATIAFFRGPFLKILVHHHLVHNHLTLESRAIPSPNAWIMGVFLMLLANLFWALWLVLQGRVLKHYPSKLLLTTLQCLLSTIQSFIIAGIVVTGVTFYLQTWVVEKKGPVFLAMTTPLIMVFTIVLSAFILGEIISFGSVLGAIILVGGLYFVLWGKTKEAKRANLESQCSLGDAEKAWGGSNEEIDN
ncbi:nodulin MtN21 /EamA-like transporter family protein [Striga asiatica]|uniref:WAT1-related protein n=1 Tax=Striga asiatica TaxID=4170 RepID=A0A5A7PR60_STRAF|nr:nodulin MtN21 /EamA-like transporter family protein [Striga asiatica]